MPPEGLLAFIAKYLIDFSFSEDTHVQGTAYSQTNVVINKSVHTAGVEKLPAQGNIFNFVYLDVA